MKASLFCLPLACCFVASCGSGGPSSVSSSTFDPLNAAGGVSQPTSMAGQQTLSPGEFVQALTDNTALFKNRGDDTAAKLLSRGTTMKVISDDGSYAKVELDDGNVGYVPSVQIGNPSQSMAADAGTGSEVQVWPPVGSTIPLPPADPGAPPEGAAGDGAPTLPPVIDPDAPAELPPLPDDAPTPGLGSAPPLEPAPAAEEAPKEKSDATETTADEETPSDAEME